MGIFQQAVDQEDEGEEVDVGGNWETDDNDSDSDLGGNEGNSNLQDNDDNIPHTILFHSQPPNPQCPASAPNQQIEALTLVLDRKLAVSQTPAHQKL